MKEHLNTIIHADCVAAMSLFETESIDLVVTSPPYDRLRSYNGYNFDFEPLADQSYRILKKGAVAVWIVGDQVIRGSETLNSFRQALYFQHIGFNIHDTMIYQKNTCSFPASRKGNRYTQTFEYMFVLSKGKPATHNLICDKENRWAGSVNWGRNTDRGRDGQLRVKKDIQPVPPFSPRNNIWPYVVGGGFGQKDRRAYRHPATFPEPLASDHIVSWSREGDVVLDPMCGSGTTCVAAKKLGRNFIGIDCSAEYARLSASRAGCPCVSLAAEKQAG